MKGEPGPIGANKAFTKYFTFPDYDAEEEKLKLEGWLCLIWDEIDPVEWLRSLT